MGADKKKLDDRWLFQAVDMMIGPHMAILMARDAEKAAELVKIIYRAVRALHEENEYETTNEWVVAACSRIWDMYNTFMTAMLIDRYDKGVPSPPIITVVKGGGSVN